MGLIRGAGTPFRGDKICVGMTQSAGQIFTKPRTFFLDIMITSYKLKYDCSNNHPRRGTIMKKYGTIFAMAFLSVVFAVGVAYGTVAPFPTWLTKITGGEFSFSSAGVMTPVTTNQYLVKDTLQHVVHATYDESVDGGGTVGTDIDLGVGLPSKAIITRAYYYVSTALNSVGTPNDVSVYCEDANNIITATNYTSNGTAGFHDGVESGAASAMKEGISAACNLKLKVATHSLTAGKMDIWVNYVASAN